MVMVALYMLNIFSYAKLNIEQMPNINFPNT